MKRALLAVYAALEVVLAVSTLTGGTEDGGGVSAVYGSWWFAALWGVLAAGVVAAMVCLRALRRVPLLLMHGAFVVILAGAAATWLTSRKGYVHLPRGVEVGAFQSAGGGEAARLPFTLRLDSFAVQCYPGTDTPADYVSLLTVTDAGGAAQSARVSMNRILRRGGYRLYQSSYDEGGAGSWLSVNYDPWGTALTYTGYALLFLAMCAALADPRGGFRALLRHPLLRRGMFALALCVLPCAGARAERSLPAFNRAKADSLARRQVVYNGRVAPFNTFARDFLLKIYGKSTYGGLTPEQVVSGWLLRPEVWADEPMILVKSERLRGLLGVEGKYARFRDFFGADGVYRLQRYWKGGAAGGGVPPSDPLQKAVAETDERVALVAMLTGGELIRPLPKGTPPLSEARVTAELLYNRLPLTLVLFVACLTAGFLAAGRMVYLSVKEKAPLRGERAALPLFAAAAALALAAWVGLRWYVSGHVPLSNGFETMQFMALAELSFVLALWRRFPVLLPFGLIVAGFALLVAHLGQSSPQVTNLMPVLASPWLSLHVSVVMAGYSLLALVMATGVLGLCLRRQEERLMLLGRLLLYPAVFFLGAGIFLGAVWANVSWGSYWSWDPKEVWALVTFMVYALGFHTRSLPWLARPRHFHLFSVLAFLTVLMTYFGVNFFLGGMHSYAG